MDGIREYIIGVVAAAVLCGIILSLIGTKGMIGLAMKFLTGLIMLLVVIRPWLSVSMDGVLDWTDDITADGTDIIASGEEIALEAYRKSIIERTQAYILDEARALDCSLSVEVILTDDKPPIPKQVRLSGEVSPYARKAISTMLMQKLGISEEDQIWT